jgi:hypothetical protein
MTALLGIVVGILLICLACVSVKPPRKVYLTCKIFKVQVVWQSNQERWVAKVMDRRKDSEPTWIVFHNEVKEGQVVDYIAFEESEDNLTHGRVFAVISNDSP